MEQEQYINNLAYLLAEQIKRDKQIVASKGKMNIGDVKIPNDKSGAEAAVNAAKIDDPVGGPSANYEKASPKNMKKDNVKEGVNNMIPKSSFDSLFKSTINEQDEMLDDELEGGDDFEVDDAEGDEDIGEEVDVATRLEMIKDDLDSVISAIRGETEDDVVDDFEDDGEDDLGEGEDIDDGLREAVSQPEPRQLSDSGGKRLMGKGSIKVRGKLSKAASGRGNIGKITNSPEPRPFTKNGKSLTGKGKIKVSASRIKTGKDIYTQ